MRILLPGEKEGRRGFLKKGLVGAALLAAAGGGAWLATRRTRPWPASRKPLLVFDAAQAAVLAALAERLVPEHPGFPRPAEVDVVSRADAIAAMAHPASQKELRQVVSLFESAAFGLLDWSPRLFTECGVAEQDRRLRAWAGSRIAVRRTGYRALKQLLSSAYYSSPATWAAVGYAGPPAAAPGPRREMPGEPPLRRETSAGPAPRRETFAAPELPPELSPPPPRPRRFQAAPVAPAASEPVPAPAAPEPVVPDVEPPLPGGARGP